MDSHPSPLPPTLAYGLRQREKQEGFIHTGFRLFIALYKPEAVGYNGDEVCAGTPELAEDLQDG